MQVKSSLKKEGFEASFKSVCVFNKSKVILKETLSSERVIKQKRQKTLYDHRIQCCI